MYICVIFIHVNSYDFNTEILINRHVYHLILGRLMGLETQDRIIYIRSQDRAEVIVE